MQGPETPVTSVHCISGNYNERKVMSLLKQLINAHPLYLRSGSNYLPLKKLTGRLTSKLITYKRVKCIV